MDTMHPPASPASLSDTTLDSLDEAEGIFFSPHPPQERYYQSKLSRARQPQSKLQIHYTGKAARLTPLDLTNETESPSQPSLPSDADSHICTPDRNKSPSPSSNNALVTGEGVSAGATAQRLARTTATPNAPTLEDSEKSRLPRRSEATTADDIQGNGVIATSAPQPHVRPPSPNLASRQQQMAPRQSINLISFDPQQVLSPTKVVPCTPKPKRSESRHLLDSTPRRSPSRGYSRASEDTSQSVDFTLPGIFSPATTKSFLLPVVPIASPSPTRSKPLMPIAEEDGDVCVSEPEDIIDSRPAKKTRVEPTTPLKSSTYSRPKYVTPPVKKILSAIYSGKQSPAKPSAMATPRRTSLRPELATESRATPKRIQLPTAQSNILRTPVRSAQTPRQVPHLSESTTKHRSFLSTAFRSPAKSEAAGLQEGPAERSSLDFKFTFASKSPAANRSTTAIAAPKPPSIPLTDFKFVPGPPRTATSLAISRISSPTKGHTRPLEGYHDGTLPIRFNLASISPRKTVGSPGSSAKGGQLNNSVLGSPVRPAKPLIANSSSTEAVASPMGKEPYRLAKDTTVFRPASPLKPLNIGASITAAATLGKPKPSGLPLPKAPKANSKLPRPAATALPVRRTTRARNVVTVNMVHVPPMGLPAREVSPPPRQSKPGPRRHREVVPGTLTGWEGKPEAIKEPTRKSSPPKTPSPEPQSRSSTPNSGSEDPEKEKPKRRQPVRAAKTSPSTPTGSPSSSSNRPPNSSDSPSPRRSRRLSGEDAENLPIPQSQQPEQAASTRPRRKAATTAKPRSAQAPNIGFQLSETQLRSLTTRNTSHNERYFVDIDIQVVRKDGPRPPSPTPKVRQLVPSVDDDEDTDDEDDNEPESADKDDSERPSKHFRGAGDDEDYETPKRRRIADDGTYVGGGPDTKPFAALKLGSPMPTKSVREGSTPSSSDGAERYVKPNSKGKFVKWDRKLVFDCEKDRFHLKCDKDKGILAKSAASLHLDPQGNHPKAKELPPELKKDKVVVVRLLYADDPDPDAPPPPPPPAVKKNSKRKRT